MKKRKDIIRIMDCYNDKVCKPNMCDNLDSCNKVCEKVNTCKYEFDLKEMPACKKITKEEMLEQLKSYNFAVIELGLYLDTHPDDEKALVLHNEYSNKYKLILEQYEKAFGPITIMCASDKWKWIDEPWPWEGGKI